MACRREVRVRGGIGGLIHGAVGVERSALGSGFRLVTAHEDHGVLT